MDEMDQLLEFGLTVTQAANVLAWHEAEARKQSQVTGGVVVVRLLDYLFKGHSDASVRLRLTALAFAFKLEHLAGYTSQAEAADVLGCSQQAISAACNQARKVLEG